MHALPRGHEAHACVKARRHGAAQAATEPLKSGLTQALTLPTSLKAPNGRSPSPAPLALRHLACRTDAANAGTSSHPQPTLLMHCTPPNAIQLHPSQPTTQQNKHPCSALL
eukprot:351839-Chlamydomonas_euryale.AAC.3